MTASVSDRTCSTCATRQRFQPAGLGTIGGESALGATVLVSVNAGRWLRGAQELVARGAQTRGPEPDHGQARSALAFAAGRAAGEAQVDERDVAGLAEALLGDEVERRLAETELVLASQRCLPGGQAVLAREQDRLANQRKPRWAATRPQMLVRPSERQQVRRVGEREDLSGISYASACRALTSSSTSTLRSVIVRRPAALRPPRALAEPDARRAPGT